MSVVRDFFHKMVDILCDIFKRAWNYMVGVVKAIIRFVGRAVDFFNELYTNVWDAIKRGAKTIYVFMFGKPDPTSTSQEQELADLFTGIIDEAKKTGSIQNVDIGLTMLSAVYDNTTEKIDDMSFKAFNIESTVSDPGMASITKKLGQDKRPVKITKIS